MRRHQFLPGVFFDGDPGGGGGAPPATPPTTPPATGAPPQPTAEELAERQRIGTQQKREGQQAQRKATAKALGLPEDTDQATLDGVLAALAFQRAEADAADTAAMTDAERIRKAAETAQATADARTREANERIRASIVRDVARDAGAVATLTAEDGTTSPGPLDDVIRLATIEAEFDPADEAAYRTAAVAAIGAVKDRYPTMFGGQATPPAGTPPRPPSTTPAGGGPAGPPPGGQPATGALERGAERAKRDAANGAPTAARPKSRNPFADA